MYRARRARSLLPGAGLGLEVPHMHPVLSDETAGMGFRLAGRNFAEYRIGARILLHLSRLRRLEVGESAPEGRTQAGIAATLGSSRASVTQALQSLEDGGAVRVARGHVEGRVRRLKVYELTSIGEALVRHILDGMGG
jgi:CRP-like cAMP-binding protein